MVDHLQQWAKGSLCLANDSVGRAALWDSDLRRWQVGGTVCVGLGAPAMGLQSRVLGAPAVGLQSRVLGLRQSSFGGTWI